MFGDDDMHKNLTTHRTGKSLLIAALLAVMAGTPAWAGAQGSGKLHTHTKQAKGAPVSSAVATDQWAVRLVAGTDPHEVAARHGAVVIGPVAMLPDTWLLQIAGSNTREPLAAASLRDEPRVVWSEQQMARQRYTRWSYPTDPLFSTQWHLDNQGQSFGTPNVDVNIDTVWSAEGLSGSGVVIGIVDDGLQYAHPDLAGNYRSDLSYDFNYGDADPAPGADDPHGTSAAGVAAAGKDNGSCGIGAAFEAGLAGLRLISAPATDAQEANALSHQHNAIHVYNNSWGPEDSGAGLDGPGTTTLQALEQNTATGRNGRGSIYVWAAGNGLQNLDNVNYDGYASSRFTIAVGAVDHKGVQSYYSEPGASMLVVAPSSGDGVGIVTTDLMGADGYNTASGSAGNCTNTFGGTSSAAPLAAGVIALLLQANPNLGWRDVQHILVHTARKNDAAHSGWSTNGADHPVNHRYGFGLIDAAAAVAAAKTWSNVPAAISVDSGSHTVNRPIPDGVGEGVGGTPVTDTIEVARDLLLEHVEVVFDATHTYRGDLEVVLIAPSGVESRLAELRNDSSEDGYPAWRFTSVRQWDENARGNWRLRVTDKYIGDTGHFKSWRLVLHGTEVAAPQFDLAPGNYDSAISVGLTSTVPGAVIRYATDGSSPTASSPIYTAPIAITAGQTVTIRARAYKYSTPSEEIVGTYSVAGSGEPPPPPPPSGSGGGGGGSLGWLGILMLALLAWSQSGRQRSVVRRGASGQG